MTITQLNALNLMVNLPETDREIFPISKIYPLPKNYEECVLPADHPWAAQAREAVESLNLAIKNRKLERTFRILGGYPEFVLTQPKLPFVIKIRLGKSDDSEACIKRVLLAQRVKSFTQEHQLEFCCPEKFLIALDPNGSKKFSYKNYAVLAEKMDIATYDPDIESQIKKLQKKQMPIPDKLIEQLNNQPDELWKKIPTEVREKRKVEAAFTIAMLGIEDSHSSNVVLLTNGRLCHIDLNEPNSVLSFGRLLDLYHFQNGDIEGLNRENEILDSKKGLKKFLNDSFRQIKYDEGTNDALYKKMICMLDREVKINKLHRKCRKMMESQLFEIAHSKISQARSQNLQERVFFLVRSSK